VGVQKVRQDRGGTEQAGEHSFVYAKGNENHELGTVLFSMHKRIVSPVNIKKFIKVKKKKKKKKN
jgi:hypothetical protein